MVRRWLPSARLRQLVDADAECVGDGAHGRDLGGDLATLELGDIALGEADLLRELDLSEAAVPAPNAHRTLAADVLPKVFEPLYSTKSFGVGLGLPMVKQILEQHGGGVEIENQESGGARVLLWLPADQVEKGAGT